MTAKQMERLITVVEKMEVSFTAMVALMQKRLELDHPVPGEIEDAQFVKVGEGNADQPESKEAYEEFPADQPTSFQAVLEKLKQGS